MNRSPAAFRRSRRASALQLSEIVQISEAAKAMKAAGEPVLSFGTGEPDFPTPAHICAAAHSAALAGETGYPPTQGTLRLRTAVADQAGFVTSAAAPAQNRSSPMHFLRHWTPPTR